MDDFENLISSSLTTDTSLVVGPRLSDRVLGPLVERQGASDHKGLPGSSKLYFKHELCVP